MKDHRRFVEGTWQLYSDAAKQACIETILVRLCHAPLSSCCSLTLPELERRLDDEASIYRLEFELEQDIPLSRHKSSAFVTLSPEPVMDTSNTACYEQHVVRGSKGPSQSLSRRACIIEIMERYSGSRRDLAATTNRLEEYLAEDDLIRSVTFFLPKQDTWSREWTTEACVTLNDKDPDATPDQISGQHYVQGDWHETADESKKSCIVKILARYSDSPKSSYCLSMTLMELEKRLDEAASILEAKWKKIERRSGTVCLRQSAYVTLNDEESLADVDPDSLIDDGESLTFSDSDTCTTDGHAAFLDASAIHQDSRVSASAALLKAQEVFRKVFPERSVPASVTACKKDLQFVLDQIV